MVKVRIEQGCYLLMTGEIVRFDVFVIVRLCNYLSCTIEEIVEYTRNEIVEQ